MNNNYNCKVLKESFFLEPFFFYQTYLILIGYIIGLVFCLLISNFFRCDSLNSTRQGREGDPKRFPRLVIGHKSNRMNLRFLISSIGSITYGASALSKNVFNIFVTGMQGYACIEQDGYSASFIYRPPMYDGPLALNSTVGFKFAECPRILNDLWVLNLRCTRA